MLNEETQSILSGQWPRFLSFSVFNFLFYYYFFPFCDFLCEQVKAPLVSSERFMTLTFFFLRLMSIRSCIKSQLFFFQFILLSNIGILKFLFQFLLVYSKDFCFPILENHHDIVPSLSI